MPQPLTKAEQAVLRQYQRYRDAEAAARKFWNRKDRELSKLARLAKLGRRARCAVRISDERAIEIRNVFLGQERVFAKAFARKYEVKEVAWEQ